MAIQSMQLANRDQFDTRELVRAGELRKQIETIYKSIESYKVVEGPLGMLGFEEYEGGRESEGVASFRHHDQAAAGRAVAALQKIGFPPFKESHGVTRASATIKGARMSVLVQMFGQDGCRVMLTFGAE